MTRKKKANPRWFDMDDGRRVRFDMARFHEEVIDAKRERSCSATDLYREIIKTLYSNYPSNQVDSAAEMVKKWDQGRNGPTDLLEIYKPLADFFGCEEDAFLLYEKAEENDMNTATVQTTAVQPDAWTLSADESHKLISAIERAGGNAMLRAKEKEVAHELYGIMVDMIAAYLPADEKFWRQKSEELSLQDKLKEYPKRCPIERAIMKASLYLPKEVRYKAESLLEDMYGPQAYIWEEFDKSQKTAL